MYNLPHLPPSAILLFIIKEASYRVVKQTKFLDFNVVQTMLLFYVLFLYIVLKLTEATHNLRLSVLGCNLTHIPSLKQTLVLWRILEFIEKIFP